MACSELDRNWAGAETRIRSDMACARLGGALPPFGSCGFDHALRGDSIKYTGAARKKRGVLPRREEETGKKKGDGDGH